jgi:hypothetical protein
VGNVCGWCEAWAERCEVNDCATGLHSLSIVGLTWAHLEIYRVQQLVWKHTQHEVGPAWETWFISRCKKIYHYYMARTGP